MTARNRRRDAPQSAKSTSPQSEPGRRGSRTAPAQTTGIARLWRPSWPTVAAASGFEQRLFSWAACRLRVSWCAQALLAVLLFVAALWSAPEVRWAYIPPTRLVLFLALSGLPVAIALKRTWLPMELLAVPLIFSLLVWSTAFVLLRSIGIGALAPWIPGILATACAVFDLVRRPKRRLHISRWTRRDAVALLTVFGALGPAIIVLHANGPTFTQEGQPTYTAHGWLAADTFYFTSLAQMSVERQSRPVEIPMVATAPNYYPTFLHSGVGALCHAGGVPTAIGIFWVWIPIVLATVALVPLAAYRRLNSVLPLRGIADVISSSLLLVVIFALRADLFLDPQSSTFALGPLLLMVWLLGPLPRNRATSSQLALLGMALAIGAALVFAHSLTGAVAVALLGTEAVLRLLRANTRRQAIVVGAGALVLGVAFLLLNRLPYSPEKIPAGVSPLPAAVFSAKYYRSLWEIPVAVVIGAAIIALLSPRHRSRLSGLMLIGPLLIGLIYLYSAQRFTSDHDWYFVTFNATRLFYLAIILAVPTLLGLRMPLRLAAAAVFVLSMNVRPIDPTIYTWNSVARDKGVTIDRDWLTAFYIARTNTPSDARIHSIGPVNGPAFTGRAELPNTDRSFYAFNMIPDSEHLKLYQDRLVISTPAKDAADTTNTLRRMDTLARHKIQMLLVELESATDPAAVSWVQRNLTPGSSRILTRVGKVAVIDVHSSRR